MHHRENQSQNTKTQRATIGTISIRADSNDAEVTMVSQKDLTKTHPNATDTSSNRSIMTDRRTLIERLNPGDVILIEFGDSYNAIRIITKIDDRSITFFNQTIKFTQKQSLDAPKMITLPKDAFGASCDITVIHTLASISSRCALVNDAAP